MNIKNSNPDFQVFKEKFEKLLLEEKEKQNVEKEEDLVLPEQNSQKHGTIALVKLNNIALTTEGKLTKTHFFENMLANNEHLYGDIVLTPEEAHQLSATYRRLSTGVSAVVPMKCTGDKCPFKDDCIYYQINKAPIGRPCKLEYDLLAYHTQKFIEQFNIDPDNHTDIMLVQELSELLIYEMRIARILGGWLPNNDSNYPAQAMMSKKTKFTPDGEIVEEESLHWAFDAMDRIKNRRLKILDALIGTPKTKKIISAKEKVKEESEIDRYMKEIKEIRQILHGVSKNVADVEFEEQQEQNGQ